MIARFGKVYIPDYAIKYLDIGFDLESYYHFDNDSSKLQHVYSPY